MTLRIIRVIHKIGLIVSLLGAALIVLACVAYFRLPALDTNFSDLLDHDSAVGMVRDASGRLARESDVLKSVIGEFLAGMRAA